MSNLYTGPSGDPFGGRYQRRGLVFGRQAEENSPARPRQVSGVAMAIGMFLVWAAFFGPLLGAGLAALSSIAEAAGAQLPPGAPSPQVSALVMLGTWLVSAITALVARHNLRRLRTTGALVKLTISAVVLVAGLWWLIAVNGIPL